MRRVSRTLVATLVLGTTASLGQVVGCVQVGATAALQSINPCAIFNCATNGIIDPCVILRCPNTGVVEQQ